LNIEATYAAITGEYAEFPNLCFVDTLDNVGLHTAQHGSVADLFGSVTEANVARIKRQNSRRISVIIGNPPYNANQLNENENNKNREYPEIDKRIKQTYIAESTAQKTKLYDMYARFFRWASDRLDKNGVLALITNRSFIESRTFDGFRKVVEKEFSEIRIVDLGGDVRANPKLSGTRHNVFGIQTGVAISFFVKRAKHQGCRIFYARRPEFEVAEDKLAFLNTAEISALPFDEIRPDTKGNWIKQSQNDFESMLPVISDESKGAKIRSHEKAVFRLFGNGVNTARDEWALDHSRATLEEKARFFLSSYARHSYLSKNLSVEIKWSRNLKTKLSQRREEKFETQNVRMYGYRPYCNTYGYLSSLMIDELGQLAAFDAQGNVTLNFPAGREFRILAANVPTDFHYIGDTKVVGRFRIDSNRTMVDNITDWAFDRFHQRYEPGLAKPKRPITKDAIFHYVYGVLHDPIYREKYALNLKREFPRTPFYPDFWQWADWGKTLMDLHIGYESVAPYDLKRVDITDEKARKAGLAPKTLLKADRELRRIMLDSETTLSGVPAEAWEYKLGSRCALEWILDQYKEKTPRDATIRERFNNYRFADYKDKVVDLLVRVTTVSIETQRIVEAMRNAQRA